MTAQAPSNIALIKYMGKKNSLLNFPENASLSLTLNGLCTVAELKVTTPGGGSTRWIPEAPSLRAKSFHFDLPWIVPSLNEESVSRVLRHLERVKSAIPDLFSRYDLDVDFSRLKNADFSLRTANTFPAASGIASSASSFAAVTLATAAACSKGIVRFQKVWDSELRFKRELAQISRIGSGSSCRSFEGPWVLWQKETAQCMETKGTPEMAHFVILVSTEIKKVSSSDAHSRVRTSPLWVGRAERVEERTQKMRAAFQLGDLPTVARIAWSEAWEMHSLFHTCSEPFSYWEPGTIEGLQWFSSLLQESSPPIVTLDAGANIHVIIEKTQRIPWRKRLQDFFQGRAILEDEQGMGANLIGVLGEDEQDHLVTV